MSLKQRIDFEKHKRENYANLYSTFFSKESMNFYTNIENSTIFHMIIINQAYELLHEHFYEHILNLPTFIFEDFGELLGFKKWKRNFTHRSCLYLPYARHY